MDNPLPDRTDWVCIATDRPPNAAKKQIRHPFMSMGSSVCAARPMPVVISKSPQNMPVKRMENGVSPEGMGAFRINFANMVKSMIKIPILIMIEEQEAMISSMRAGVRFMGAGSCAFGEKQEVCGRKVRFARKTMGISGR